MILSKILQPTPDNIIISAQAIKRGDLVIFPTETVYGLGADATNVEAVKKIFVAKGRPIDNPLIVHIADLSQLSSVVENVSNDAKLLISKFWPGPLTIVLKKNSNIPNEVSAGLDTVGVRMPNNPIALDFLRACGCSVAAPSANISTKPSGTRLDHLLADFTSTDNIAFIIDGGESEIGIESTVVDMTSAEPTILRPGVITAEMIEKVLNKKVNFFGEKLDTEAPKSPGMKYRHYAPQAVVRLVSWSEAQKLVQENKIIVYAVDNESLFASLSEQNLYNIFRQADVNDQETVYILDSEALHQRVGLYNRILKASEGV
jgi:L-threonylcarbamoyladenylate synthase